MTSDLELLQTYARHRSDDAFAELVRRRLDLVYCAALRQVRCPQLAEEVAQSAFTDLARKAAALSHRPVLTGWLYNGATLPRSIKNIPDAVDYLRQVLNPQTGAPLNSLASLFDAVGGTNKT